MSVVGAGIRCDAAGADRLIEVAALGPGAEVAAAASPVVWVGPAGVQDAPGVTGPDFDGARRSCGYSGFVAPEITASGFLVVYQGSVGVSGAAPALNHCYPALAPV